jgi:hypothetical protein
MLGIGAGLIADAATSSLHDKHVDRHGRHGQDS